MPLATIHHPPNTLHGTSFRLLSRLPCICLFLFAWKLITSSSLEQHQIYITSFYFHQFIFFSSNRASTQSTVISHIHFPLTWLWSPVQISHHYSPHSIHASSLIPFLSPSLISLIHSTLSCPSFIHISSPQRIIQFPRYFSFFPARAFIIMLFAFIFFWFHLSTSFLTDNPINIPHGRS